MRKLRKAPGGQGRAAVLDLAADERKTLDEVSSLEMRLARIRSAIVGQCRARTAPPRVTPIRNFLR
jgi:hypothetical protein